MTNDESPPLANVIFSYMFIGNTLLFLFLLPAIIYQASSLKNEMIWLVFCTFFLIIYSVFSFKAFYEGIDMGKINKIWIKGYRVESNREFFLFF